MCDDTLSFVNEWVWSKVRILLLPGYLFCKTFSLVPVVISIILLITQYGIIHTLL